MYKPIYLYMCQSLSFPHTGGKSAAQRGQTARGRQLERRGQRQLNRRRRAGCQSTGNENAGRVGETSVASGGSHLPGTMGLLYLIGIGG